MTFLNPLYLIALAAAAIPIILHLLNLRKTRIIEFSTLTFLKELQRSKIRKLKLKQWLLLALRTLIIIFIVLAFTRPAVRSSFGFLPGTRAKTSVVIVMDDSFSMLVSDDNGQLLKQAKDKARAILDILKPGDEAVLIKASESPKEGKQFTAAFNAIRNDIDAATPSFKHVNFREALTAASVLLQKSNNFNKEIYIIGDEQRSHYTSETTQKPVRLFGGETKIFLSPLGEKRVDNTAITDVKIVNSFFEKDKPVDISAAVLNDGGTPISNGIVSVFLDGERVVQKTLDVDAGARKQVDFTVIPKKSGFVEGFVEIEDDALPEDNRRYFAFYIPDQLRILLSPAGTQDATIVRLGLKPAAAAADVPSVFQIDAVDKNSLLSASLTKYDVVVLLGAQGVTQGFATRLAGYVRDGGGVVIFPDADGNEQNLTQVLLPALAMPPAGGTTGSLANKNSYTTFGTIDFDHPLFKNIFALKDKNKKPEIETPKMYYSLRIRGNENSQQVIATSGGDAFLIEHRLGKGKALFFAVAPNLQWSDFPFKGIFLPLLNRSMFYLASREDYVHNDIVGRPFELSIPAAAVTSATLDLKAPSGNVTRMAPKSLPSGMYFTMDNLDQPGVYQFLSEGRPVRKIPVNIDPTESEMQKVTTKERDTFFQTIGANNVKILSRDTNIQQAVTEARFGVELWKYMLALALLCALAEMFVARDAKRNIVEN